MKSDFKKRLCVNYVFKLTSSENASVKQMMLWSDTRSCSRKKLFTENKTIVAKNVVGSL